MLEAYDKYIEQFSNNEKKSYMRIRYIRDKIFYPLAFVLHKTGLNANKLSYFGLFVLIGFIVYVKSNPVLAAIFLILHVVIDGVDGVLARSFQKESTQGELVDMICDHTGMFIVVLSLGWRELIDSTIGLLYVYSYTILMVFIVIRHMLKIPIKLWFRSKFFLYAIYLLWVFTEYNYMNKALLVFSILIIPSTLISFVKIKNKLRRRKHNLRDVV